MKKIDSLIIQAKKNKNAKDVDPRIVGYLEYAYHLAVCEFNGIENELEPPEGYEEYMNKPIEPPDQDSPDYPIYQEVISMMSGEGTESDTNVTIEG